MQAINRTAIFIMLLIYLAIGMHIFIPGMGGSGLRMPGNIVAWVFIALSVLAYWLLNSHRNITITTTFRLIFNGVVFLLIPLLYTPEKWLRDALFQMAGVMAGLAFYFTLLQCRFSEFWRVRIINLLLFAVLLQGGIGFIQLSLLSPDSGLMALSAEGARPTGVFRQVNVMASFMATGIASALYLLYLPQSSDASQQNAPLVPRLLRLQQLAALVLLPAMLVLLQSRAGYIGAVIVIVANFALRWREFPRQTIVFAGLIILGLLTGYSLMMAADLVTPVSHEGSNLERWKILQITLAMIATHPLSGWGYGSFEYSFAHFALGMTPPIAGMGVITHPHNELLFGWVEGGISALLGYVLIAVAFIRLMFLAWRQVNKHCFALWLLMMPIAIHSQLEYPFYMSTAHWLIFLLLLSLTDVAVSNITVVSKPKMNGVIRMAMCLAALAGLTLMLPTLQTQILLTKAEQLQMKQARIHFPLLEQQLWQPWLLRERVDYDRQVSQLLQYNQSRAPQILQHYLDWSQVYLSRHVDANVYASRIAILRFNRDVDEAEKLRQEASQIFNRDIRFQLPAVIAVQESK